MSRLQDAETLSNHRKGSIMQTIPQDTFLTTEDVKDLLKGKIKLKRLVRDFGLRGFAKGYWSNAVIVALDRTCGILPSERDQGASENKEVSHGKIFDKEGRNQSWRLLGDSTEAQFCSPRSFSRNDWAQVFALGNGARSVESQLERLDRKASQEAQSRDFGRGC